MFVALRRMTFLTALGFWLQGAAPGAEGPAPGPTHAQWREYLARTLDQRAPGRLQRFYALEPAPGGGADLRDLAAAPGLSARDRTAIALGLARRLREQGDLAGARAQYAGLLAAAELGPREKLDVRLEAAHAAFVAKDYAAARSGYAEVIAAPDAPAHYKSAAQLRIAASHAREKNEGAARAEYAKLVTMPGAPDHHRWEAEECVREMDRARRGLAPRDPARSRVQAPRLPAPGVELFVAPDGDDAAPGTREQPFATLERARDRLREIKKQGGLPPGGAAVWLRGGRHARSRTFTLTAEDSGTAETPVVYRAVPGERPRLCGGARIEQFAPVTDAAILARLPEEARAKVVRADLAAAGVKDYGKLAPRGYGRGTQAQLEVFFNQRPLQPARWPNQGFVKVARPVADEGAPVKRGFAFEYEGDRPARWTTAPDAWLYGYWVHLWADNYLPVASIDPQKRRITVGDGGGYRGVRDGAPYFALNLLEELDAPGEWYLDRATGVLYLYPPGEGDSPLLPRKARADEDPSDRGKSGQSPADLKNAVVEVSVLAGPFVQMDQVSHVRIQGLVMELGRADGAVISGGAHCLLAGCTVRKVAGTAAVVSGGTGHGVLGCDFHTLGRGGCAVRGGDRKTLAPGGHFVENCHVYDFSRIDRTYTPAVLLEGVGNRVAHNRFHHSPGHAMRVEGNDHLIELNEVHHVVTETDDQGGLDMWGNPTYRGNVLRYNYWHHVESGRQCGQAGIRLDDAISGTLVYGNVFYRCSEALFGGVQIHGGKENVVDNNLFVECNYAVSFSGWGANRWAEFLAGDHVARQLKEADIRNPPYSTRYPALARLAEDPDVNSVWRNIVLRCGGFLARDRGIQDLRDNLILPSPGGRGAGGEGRSPSAPPPTETPPAAGEGRLPPGLPDEAALDAIGFRPIPYGEIGLYEDEFRSDRTGRGD